MVVSNCSIYGCSNSRNKTKGLGTFRIRTKDDDKVKTGVAPVFFLWLWFSKQMLLFTDVEDVIQKRPLQMLFKIDVLKDYVIFTGKQLCWNNFIKKRLQHRCLPISIAKFLRTVFLWNTSSGCFWTFTLFSKIVFLNFFPLSSCYVHL